MSAAGRPARLNPRSPWVLDTRDLPRGPGSMKELKRTVPLDEPMGNDMIAVPAGDELQLAIRMESVSEGIWVSGLAVARVLGECGRCLDPIDLPTRARFSELYAYDPPEIDEEDLDAPDVSLIQDELIDLEPVVRDAILLGFPLNPLCRAECSGLCSECGVRLDDLEAPAEHGHDIIDPRWAALGDLAKLTESQPPEDLKE